MNVFYDLGKVWEIPDLPNLERERERSEKLLNIYTYLNLHAVPPHAATSLFWRIIIMIECGASLRGFPLRRFDHREQTVVAPPRDAPAVCGPVGGETIGKLVGCGDKPTRYV